MFMVKFKPGGSLQGFAVVMDSSLLIAIILITQERINVSMEAGLHLKDQVAEFLSF